MKQNEEKKEKIKKNPKDIESDVYYDPDGLKETPENPLITKIKNIKDFWKE
jgi:hypothetical protein